MKEMLIMVGGVLLLILLLMGSLVTDRYFASKCAEAYVNSTKTALEIKAICN